MNWKFAGDRPVYQQIMAAIRGAILKGELPPGGKVPSVRDLAAQAQVNPNTMQRALTELEREGLLVSGGTSAYIVKILREAGHLGFERVVLPIRNAERLKKTLASINKERQEKGLQPLKMVGIKNISEVQNLF